MGLLDSFPSASRCASIAIGCFIAAIFLLIGKYVESDAAIWTLFSLSALGAIAFGVASYQLGQLEVTAAAVNAATTMIGVDQNALAIAMMQPQYQ